MEIRPQLREQLRQLKMPGMRQALETRLAEARQSELAARSWTGWSRRPSRYSPPPAGLTGVRSWELFHTAHPAAERQNDRDPTKSTREDCHHGLFGSQVVSRDPPR